MPSDKELRVPGSCRDIPREYHAGDHLTKLQLHEKLVSIGEDAFKGCTGLTSVVIPESTEQIGRGAFAGCPALRRVELPVSAVIGRGAFEGTPFLKKKPLSKFLITKNGVLLRYWGHERHVRIPAQVRSIAGSAFEGNDSVVTLDIPPGVEVIGGGAFMQCTSLQEVRLPAGLRIIGKSAFEGCTFLEGVTLPERTEVIGDRAFFGCTAITEVFLPRSVYSVGEEAFAGCESLETVTVQSLMLSLLRKKAFSGCTRLTELTLPHTPYVPESMCENCRSLRHVTLKGKPRKIGDKAFRNCHALEQITGLDFIQPVGDEAFAFCTSLREIVFGDELTELGCYVFDGCTALRRAVLGAGRSIAYDAFRGCTALEEVQLPASVERISQNPFADAPWYKGLAGDFIVLGNGILMAYRGRSSAVVLPDNVRMVHPDAFAERRITAVTMHERVQGMTWRFIPGLRLTLVRKGFSVTFQLDDRFQGPGSAERHLSAFWQGMAEGKPPSFQEFREIWEKEYMFPVSVLMFRSSPDSDFFADYVRRNSRDILKNMVDRNDLENLEAFLQMGFVTQENADELLDYAICSTQKTGNSEPQVFLMEYKQKSVGYGTIEEIFESTFDL